MYDTFIKLHATPRLIVLLLLTLLSPHRSLGQEKPAAAEAGREQQVQSGEYIGKLELGKPVAQELAGVATHVYGLNLTAGQFVHVIVEQRGIDVIVLLIGPDGKKIVEVDSPNGTQGTEPLFVIAEVTGRYRLEVRSLEKAAPLGRYVITLAQMRAATASDKALVSELGEAGRLSDEISRLSAAGKFKEAIPLAERVVLIKEKTFGGDHIDVAAVMSELAKLYQAQGNYASAETAYLRVLEIREKTFGAAHQDVAGTLNNLGSLYYLKGDYARAEAHYQRALNIREKVFDANDPRIATTLSNMALLYEVKGDYARSEVIYQRALAIYQKTLGPEHPFVASVLNNLGALYKEIGDYVRAERLYLRALEIREKTRGPIHLEVAETLNNLAVLYREQDQPERAEPLYLRALAIDEKLLGPEHPYVALILGNLAVIYDEKEDYARAEKSYLRAIAIYEKAHGPEHPELASILINLAEQYRVKGEYKRAEPIYLRALAIREKAFGAEYPLVADVLHNLGALNLDRENYSQAVELLTRRDEIRERNLALLLNIGSEEQKRRFLQRVSRETDGTVSLHVRYAPNYPQAADLALTTVLRRKGRVLDAMSGSFGVLRRRLNPDDRAVLDQLFTAYSQYAALADKGLGSGAPAERRTAAAEIRFRIEQLEALVSRSSAAFRTQKSPITLMGVQKALPEGTALVEVVLFRPLDVKAKTKAERYGQPRYVAYVLRREGPPAWVDLGEADVIDRDVAELRRVLNDPRLTVKRLARALDEKVMLPVRRLLRDTRRVFISPDGALNLLPFGALIDERGKYLIENYSFTYLTSGRDLLRLKTSEGGESAAIVVADPAFDVAVTSGTASASLGDTAQGRRAADLKDARLAPLPATREEAERIKALLPEAQLLLGTEATEAGTKHVSHPRILHIATHGFFLENEPHTPNFENPLLRSGLFLAGASKRQSGPGEDGVLTALEVSGLDLWGTKLVVLSACETGLGDLQNGEGVYGLRRALVLAGSETQVMSLWKVSDAGTRDLMVAYYTRLQKGEGRAEALRQVQLAMLRGQLSRQAGTGKRETSDPGEQPVTKDYHHPYYWAAFIQSGDWRSLNGK
jgi:CHAT domain-containing protein/tetratricopeptide (TPR) repeat protein